MNVLPRDGRLTFLEVLAELWIGGGAFAAWHFGSAREQEEWTGKRYIRVGSSGNRCKSCRVHADGEGVLYPFGSMMG